MKKKKQIKELRRELQWHYRYMFYISNFHNLTDAAACGYADGDEEYIEALSSKTVFNNMIHTIGHLDEYQKKQLAIVLISQTLNPLAVDQVADYIAPDPQPYDIKINWADGTTTYKDEKGATITETLPQEEDTITDKTALNEALKYF